MATKTFNIGECAIGGRIKVTTSNTKISIKVLDWETKKPIEGHSQSFMVQAGKRHVVNFLEARTTFYWSSVISDWINANTDTKSYNARTADLWW
jgi:hypothetical protein